ncbi:putative transcriptional regulator [Thiorhodovibrio winogradskyi]|uniref:Transcriptional regulator n=1 Tax=Thiorhodovibrio winogradskyi TaxID=77007 RepID=A0ABZ0SBF3_9GAMM|nr:hypothetical protein [Thiorhodovibrio winogradskyi]
MKAIISVEPWDSMQARAMRIAERLDAGEPVGDADYYLNFADTAHLFRALTPARLALLERLETMGPAPAEALMAAPYHDRASTDKDIDQLIAWELIAQDNAGRFFIPWDAIEIRVTLGHQQQDHKSTDHAQAA